MEDTCINYFLFLSLNMNQLEAFTNVIMDKGKPCQRLVGTGHGKPGKSWNFMISFVIEFSCGSWKVVGND